MNGGDGEKALAGEKRAPLEGERLERGDSFLHLILHTGRISLGSRAREKAAPRDGNGTQIMFFTNNIFCVIIVLANPMHKRHLKFTHDKIEQPIYVPKGVCYMFGKKKVSIDFTEPCYQSMAVTAKDKKISNSTIINTLIEVLCSCHQPSSRISVLTAKTLPRRKISCRYPYRFRAARKSNLRRPVSPHQRIFWC